MSDGLTRNRVLEAVFDPGPQGTDTGRQIDVVGRRQNRPFSQPVKLGKRITAWRVDDIRALIECGTSR